MKRKRLTAILLVLAMALSVSACEWSYTPNQTIPESTGGKNVEKAVAADRVFSLNSNSKYSFNPFIATNHSNQLICSLVYENMVEVDNDFNVIYNVITDGSCSEDGKVWTFNIEPGHTFHDGSPVKGNDLRMSLEYAIRSDRYAGRFASVQGVSYADDKLYVTLGIGNTQFTKLLNIPIVKAGSYEDKHPLGSGPYTYNEDFTELRAYEGYPDYEKLPVDTVYIKEYTSAEEIISAFEDSYVDVVINDPTSMNNLGYASTNETRTYVTTNMHYVGFNELGELGRYNNFRVAMQYALNREYLVENMLHNNGVAATVPMCPSCNLYPTELANTITYDLEKCATILYNFGLKDNDEDGRLEWVNGTTDLSFNMIVCSDSSAKNGMCQRFAADLDSIGITVNVYALTWDKYLEALEKGEFEIAANKTAVFDMYYAEVKLRNDFDLTELLQVRDQKEPGTNINFSGSTDRNYESLINAYLAAPEGDRARRYQELAKYLLENAGIIALGFEKQEIIVHRGVVKGVNANYGNPLYGFRSWEIDLS